MQTTSGSGSSSSVSPLVPITRRIPVDMGDGVIVQMDEGKLSQKCRESL